MGSPASETHRRTNETQHRVKLTQPFYLGVHEVTQRQWQVLMGDEPWKRKDYVKVGSSYPATYISWDDATKFCKALTKQERLAGRITALQSYRLPTEAEWEYACRAGTTSAYSFGDNASKLKEYGWVDEDAGKNRLQPIGSKKPNPWGLFDMHGNVWEWCSDGFGDYPNTAATDPENTKAVADRVYRGGGWSSDARYARSAHRSWDSPDRKYFFLGFRVALSPAVRSSK